MDARRADVFAALYEVSAAPRFSPDRIAEIEGPTAGRPDLTLDRWAPRTSGAPVVFVGDGAILYADVIRRRGTPTILPEVPLIAGTLGRLAVARAARGDTIGPAAVQPQYVRRPDAEVERERRASTDVS
jgi:tRNA A37 threonylcarbamoyladenosine modification protein TsaB